MFLCEKCLTDNFKTDMWDLMIAPRSRGACESCGNGAVCYDIPSSGLNPKDSTQKFSGKIKMFYPSKPFGRATVVYDGKEYVIHGDSPRYQRISDEDKVSVKQGLPARVPLMAWRHDEVVDFVIVDGKAKILNN